MERLKNREGICGEGGRLRFLFGLYRSRIRSAFSRPRLWMNFDADAACSEFDVGLNRFLCQRSRCSSVEVVGGGWGELGGEGVDLQGSDVGDAFVLLNESVNSKERLGCDQ